MNRSFLIVGIPAVLTSFGWLTFGWGWRLASVVTSVEVVAITGFVVYVLRRQRQELNQIAIEDTTLKSDTKAGHSI